MDTVSKKQRSSNMTAIRATDTSPEIKVRKFLFSMGFRYRLHDKSLPGKPDIVLKKHKTVIFVNGCFWHQHPGCKKATIPKSNTEYWIPKLKRNVERDKKNINFLESKGWKVIVLWECQTNKHEDMKFALRDLI